MNKILQLVRCLIHPHELRLALSGLGVRLSGDERLGGLSASETKGLLDWVSAYQMENPSGIFVEIGTLFGLTAKAVAETGVQVVAVDNFCWNPFGLTAAQHEAFTRRILEGTAVELVNADANGYLASALRPGAFVFLDGDHSATAVRREISLAHECAAIIAGHDYGNPDFDVTQVVDEILGVPDAVVGSCWMKRL